MFEEELKMSRNKHTEAQMIAAVKQMGQATMSLGLRSTGDKKGLCPRKAISDVSRRVCPDS